MASGGSYGLSDLVAQINLGTGSRLFGTFVTGAAAASTGGVLATIRGVQLITMSGDSTIGSYNGASFIALDADLLINTGVLSNASAVASYILSRVNSYTNVNFWALSGSGSGNLMFLAKTAGVTGNNLSGIESHAAFSFGSIAECAAGAFASGGNTWATASTIQSNTDNLYRLKLTGSDRGANYDIGIVSPSSLVTVAGTALGSFHGGNYVLAAWNETTDATGTGNWNGADILTQSNAQLALAQIDAAISTKESTRAGLGSLQNRLENTITNLQIQGENLQAAESRISDVDVALEMMEFTKKNILAQAATAMLAPANARPQLALQLLGGR